MECNTTEKAIKPTGSETIWQLSLDLIIYVVIQIICCLLSENGSYYGAGGLMMALGLFLFVINYQRWRFLPDLRGLLSLSWVVGEGIACLKLSRLSSDWEIRTWISIALAYLCFRIGYYLVDSNRKDRVLRSGSVGNIIKDTDEEVQASKIQEDAADKKEKSLDIIDTFSDIKEQALQTNNELHYIQNNRLFILICIVTAVSLTGFVLEAAVLGFIPIFSDAPHAYSYFHISGVHYFTVCFTFVPSLFVIYYKRSGRGSIKFMAWICLGISLLLPVMCVSRFQLIFAVGLAVIVYISMCPNMKLRYILLIILAMIPLYVLLTVFRHHDVAYLNGIFEMKNANTPIFVTQPYMYVANNFENFNCLVRELTGHSHGIRMVFPLWALTGLKFLYPSLTELPVYITKTELTTLTWIYDFFYDFGTVGVAVCTGLLGSAGAWLAGIMKSDTNPMGVLFFGQFAVYTALSFFTTWWSNPTTWFWFGVTTILFLVMNCSLSKKE